MPGERQPPLQSTAYVTLGKSCKLLPTEKVPRASPDHSSTTNSSRSSSNDPVLMFITTLASTHSLTRSTWSPLLPLFSSVQFSPSVVSNSL